MSESRASNPAYEVTAEEPCACGRMSIYRFSDGGWALGGKSEGAHGSGACLRLAGQGTDSVMEDDQ